MTSTTRRVLTFAVLSTALTLAQAQSKPALKILVGFPPGGSAPWRTQERMKRWGLLIMGCWLALAAQAQQQAWVSWVMDGDTVLLVLEGEREPVKWRIVGVDAPESCQSGGDRSRDALMALVLRRSVQIEPHGHDSYGRSLGKLWVQGQDVGAEMVRAGWAWAYSYRTGRGPYAALQREAERERRGVFAAKETAMSPAVFRQFHGSCHAEVEGQARVERVPQTGQAGSR